MSLQHHIGDQRHLCIRVRVLTCIDWAVAYEMCILFMNVTFQGYMLFWKLKWFRIWKYELFLMYVCMFELLLRYLCITQLVCEFAMHFLNQCHSRHIVTINFKLFLSCFQPQVLRFQLTCSPWHFQVSFTSNSVHFSGIQWQNLQPLFSFLDLHSCSD